ncbi:hypothetical protein PF004_g20438 [Phytophthora fragariae]|uniref:Uncharacterized protein n=1 Tax=Phytophthora fragariae TaxID=53985 RepID=A0A6G0N745_9STRA|nr:hypothetical protein PF004_g20438 [Phytophthora fragariae]
MTNFLPWQATVLTNWFAACWPAGLAVRMGTFDIGTVGFLAHRLRNVYYGPCFKSDRSISSTSRTATHHCPHQSTHTYPHTAHTETQTNSKHVVGTSVPTATTRPPRYNRQTRRALPPQ